MSTAPPKPPEILDKIVDKVLAYRPKPKSKAAKKRKREVTKRRELHTSPSPDTLEQT